LVDHSFEQPPALSALRAGERELNLGSRDAIDLLLSARRADESGFRLRRGSPMRWSPRLRPMRTRGRRRGQAVRLVLDNRGVRRIGWRSPAARRGRSRRRRCGCGW
jgi:hypothetical protein